MTPLYLGDEGMKKPAILISVLALTLVLPLVLPLAAYAAPDDDNEFASLFDNHGAVMLIIDRQTGDIVYANKAAADYYGFSKQELISMNINQINTLSPEETLSEMEAAAREERNYFVFKHRLASGEIRDVEVFSYPVVYQNKECLFSIVHDVTEKIRLEESMQRTWIGMIAAGSMIIIILAILLVIVLRNHRKLKKVNGELENANMLAKTFFDADDTVVYLKDENLRYVFVNKAFEGLYGKKPEDVAGLDDFELTGDDFAQLRRKTDQAVVDKRQRIIDEVSWNGHIYQTVKFPVKMLSGAYGVGAYVRDITKQREREIRQEKAFIRYKILVDVVSRSFRSKKEQLDYVLEKALSLTESKIGYIYLYDEESRQFTLNSWSREAMKECGIAEKQRIYSLEKTGIWGEVVRQRKPIVINDYQAPEPRKKGYPEGHVELRRFMSLPVFMDDKIVAVVGIANKPADYDDVDVYELTLLMNGVWNAVERREAQERLVTERNKYYQTIVSIGDGVMVVDREGKIEMLNMEAQKLTGWTLEEAAGRHYGDVFSLSHENPEEKMADPILTVFETDMVQEMENSAVLTSRNGRRYYIEDSAAPVKDENGQTAGVVLVFRDVTEKKEQRKRIEYLSYHDPLTGLFNRRFFEEELRRIDTRRNLPISVMMGDVNGLKLTNDIFGHASGDELLKNVADIFVRSCRADDIIARWGGDEFVVLLPKTTTDDARQLMARIKDNFAQVKIKAIKGSISLGVFTKEKIEDAIESVVDKAEGNMYLNKTVDRERVRSEAIKEIISELHKNHPEEKGHAERVSQLSYRLAKLLRLSELEAHKFKFGGLLHDIGKVTLEPSEKLLPDADDTDKGKHTTVGYRILSSFDDTLDMAEAALYHHERWDGMGYPKGIGGGDIPILARVIAVADYYDKLIYPRYGTDAKSKPEALTVIQELSGKRFDPQLVSLFVKMIKNDIGLI